MPAVNLGASNSRPRPSSSEAVELVELRAVSLLSLCLANDKLLYSVGTENFTIKICIKVSIDLRPKVQDSGTMRCLHGSGSETF
jgi:hypothetical protein